MKQKPSQTTIETMVAAGLSSREISLKVGFSKPAVLRWLKKYNLKTTAISGPKPHVLRYCQNCGSKIKGKAKYYCSKKCWYEQDLNQRVNQWKSGQRTIIDAYGEIAKWARRYVIMTRGARCEKCGLAGINPITHQSPLEINHKDGNYLNNAESNLEILCPNCHALTPTYKALNHGRGRPMRRKIN